MLVFGAILTLLFDTLFATDSELPLVSLLAAFECKASEFKDAMKYINPADQAVTNKHTEKMDNCTNSFERALGMIFNDALEGEADVKG